MRNLIDLIESAGRDVLYHGSGRITSAQAKSIIRNGLRPPKIETNHMLTPVEGRVYATPQLDYAVIYAIGGNYASLYGNEEAQAKAKQPMSQYWKNTRLGRRYGYLFVSERSATVAPIPDEDYIGELYHDAMRRDQRVIDQYGEVWLRSFVYQMDNLVTPRQKAKVLDGEYSYFAAVGKKAQKALPPHFLSRMMEMGSHVASEGNLPVIEAWRFDKVRLGFLEPKAANFFELADKIYDHRFHK